MKQAYSGSAPTISARIRSTPEDFQVFEELKFSPDGSGEHALLRVRKRTVNTHWVAKQLAAFAEVAPVAVSYAGLKDRHALTEQWFSVQLPGRADPDWSTCGGDDFTVLEQHRHSRKLKRGALKGNAFRIVLQALQGELTELEARLHRVAAEGVPNYFGEQRFGRDNLSRAEALFLVQIRVKDRHKRGLYLSAARACLFNHVLSQRITQGTWNQALEGDLMALEGSRSIFAVSVVDATIRTRVAALDIHPSGPLWGKGEPPSQAEVLQLEQAVAADFPVLCQGLQASGLKQERRALRLPVADLAWKWIAEDAVVLNFRLAAGSYATAVLRELVQYR